MVYSSACTSNCHEYLWKEKKKVEWWLIIWYNGREFPLGPSLRSQFDNQVDRYKRSMVDSCLIIDRREGGNTLINLLLFFLLGPTCALDFSICTICAEENYFLKHQKDSLCFLKSMPQCLHPFICLIAEERIKQL